MAYALERDGLQVTHCLLVQDARQQMQRQPFDLLVLDVGLPDGCGLDLLRDVRHGQAAAALRLRQTTPVLMLSARGEEAGPRAGPGAGRRRLPGQTLQPARAGRPHQGPAAPRRHAAPAAVAATPFVDDETGQRITLHGQALPLTRREYRLLSHLLRGAGRIHSRDALLAAAWATTARAPTARWTPTSKPCAPSCARWMPGASTSARTGAWATALMFKTKSAASAYSASASSYHF